MPLRAPLPVMFLSLVAVLACEREVALYCCTDPGTCPVLRDCLPKYPDRPFCDMEARYPASEGIARTCIPTPGDPLLPDAGPADASWACVMGCSAPTPICLRGACVECLSASDCPQAQKPTCEAATHSCRGCREEAECEGRAGAPHCMLEGGLCVGCRDAGDCDALAPACDETTRKCRGCRLDSECASSACDRETGRCVPDADVLHVDKNGGQTSDGCTKQAPCTTIAKAFSVARTSGARKWIRLAPASYPETLEITDLDVAVTGTGADIRPPPDRPAVLVQGSAKLAIYGVRLRGASGTDGDGLLCQGAAGNRPRVLLDAVVIDENAEQGIESVRCAIVLRRAKVMKNAGGGIKLDTSDFEVVNSMIVANGSPLLSRFGGILITTESATTTGTLSFNTIASNFAMPRQAAGVRCEVISPILASNSIAWDNQSDFGDAPAPQVAGNCQWSYSDIGPTPQDGVGNLSADPQFRAPANPALLDYHLKPSSPCVNKADPERTDVTVDFDGEARAQGGRSDVGADEVPPI
ncbi:MAG: hypothetical protein HY698_12935 [Deltaproteobacteria bacterium]|nr:hypothetical protein [Deltaproteobacteria bacterium]